MLTTTTTRPARTSSVVTATMADFILRHAASAGGVTREDLLLDFTGEEIDANLEAAKALARRRGGARQ